MARVVIDAAALAVVTKSPAGPVGLHLARGGQAVSSAAKALARVDTGRMRASVDWVVGADGGGSYVDIGASATSEQGFPYPIMYADEFLIPALDAWPDA